MICPYPLINIHDDSNLYKKYNKTFISYKWFLEKENINNYLKSKTIKMYPCRKCFSCINMLRYQ